MSRTRQSASQQLATPAPVQRPSMGPATSNAAAVAEMKASAPVQEESFLASLDTSFGAPIEDHRATLTTEDVLPNRRGSKSFPKRWEDNKLRVPKPAQRPLHADVQQADGTFSPLDLDTHSMDERDESSTYRSWYNNGKDCALATYASLEAMGYEPPKGDKNSLVKPGAIGDVQDGELQSFDPEAAKALLDSIDQALLDGVPVMAGVDYPGEQTATNADGVTDHWLLITGREYDEDTKEVRYQAMDNATADAPVRTFTVGEDYGLRSEAPEGARGAAEATYSLTNARIPERAR